MSGSARDFGSYTEVKELVAAGVLGATNAGTTAQDMGTCRVGRLLISLTVGTDVPTDVVLQHSPDGTTWTNLLAPADANFAATTLYEHDVANMYRYVRMTWTRAAAAGDSYWAIILIGDLAVRAPIS
jgi:hypothetical protein